MIQRQRSSATVDIQCVQCGKPMMMLSFNYTTLERGFESISLRCQYCKAEETRPWPQPSVDEGSTLQATPGDAAQSPSSNEVVELAEVVEVDAMVEADEFETLESPDDTRESADGARSPDTSSSSSELSSDIDDYERLRLRFARRPASPS